MRSKMEGKIEYRCKICKNTTNLYVKLCQQCYDDLVLPQEKNRPTTLLECDQMDCRKCVVEKRTVYPQECKKRMMLKTKGE